MDWHLLHGIMKDHPKEIILDDEYVNGVVIPSVEQYLKENKKLVEAVIGIYKEQVARIDEQNSPPYLCKDYEGCTRFKRDCKACYEKVIEQLEDVLVELG